MTSRGRLARLTLRPVSALVAVAFVVIGVDDAVAQQTRADTIRARQADKQRMVSPPRPNRAEVILSRLDDWGLITGTPRGLYPWVGSVYSGGGFAGGLGLRKPVGDDGAVNVFGGRSLNAFTRAQADVALPSFAGNRATLTLSGRYIDAPDVKYYGLGNDTEKGAQTRFGYSPKSGGARLDIEAHPHLSIGGGVNYLDVSTAAGRTGVSIDQRFTAADTPGLELDGFRYINSSAHATFDWRQPAGYSGSGGLYRVQVNDYRERDRDRYSFRSLEVEARQLIPLLRANWILSLRGLATLTDVDTSGAVPYFLLASVGGGSTVRGYPDFRFRDRHRLVMSAELRWTPARFVDMAMFYDTGKVAASRAALDLNGLHESYGIGLRLVSPAGYAFRVEVAHSREHAARVLVGAGGTF